MGELGRQLAHFNSLRRAERPFTKPCTQSARRSPGECTPGCGGDVCIDQYDVADGYALRAQALRDLPGENPPSE